VKENEKLNQMLCNSLTSSAIVLCGMHTVMADETQTENCSCI